ncbi:FLYWCH zinc finger domain-containing protein [Phthorimaea operculella]|nr:FLYWCH zinc finger domain-containing protein [Phthorimaea operculella]
MVVVQWVKSSRGRPLALLGGYPYYCHDRSHNRERWVCLKSSKKCRASFTATTTVPRRFTRKNISEHNHPPDKNFIIIQWVRNAAGKELALVQGYSFYCRASSQSTRTWVCTCNRRCSSRFVTTVDRRIIRARIFHMHSPPLFRMHNGIYIRI